MLYLGLPKFIALLIISGWILLPTPARAQGETTSAISGHVRDRTGGPIAGASIILAGTDNGVKRSSETDSSGHFSFPQLKPGIYTIQVSAPGFEEQRSSPVAAALGRTESIDFVLELHAVKQNVVVTGEAPLVNPENPNTSTTLSARALEDLPNPGGDMTYPLQFAAGALINTAGSGNDFVGGTNGYGNVEFNGLPALANGYIVDGLETNDPLTNLNSGLSTNLVLGLNSIAEVTVNTLSYAVDQGRYGASQVNYVTKSGTNQFHGNLYELWNGSRFNAADFFTNATPGNHKPRSTVNHFGGSLGGPILHNKLFFFFDSEWVRIALPHRHAPRRSRRPHSKVTSCSSFRRAGGMSSPGQSICRSRNWCRSTAKCLRFTATRRERRWRCWDVRSTAMEVLAAGAPPNGNGCANRQSVSHSSDDHEQVQTGRIDYNIDEKEHDVVPVSVRHAVCRRPIRIRSIRCSTPFRRSRSIPSRLDTRMCFRRIW